MSPRSRDPETDTVTLRLDPNLLARLDAESEEQGRSARVRTILERYWWLIDRAVPEMAIAEWNLIMDAMNGIAHWDGAELTAQVLYPEISDSISLNGLDRKWLYREDEPEAAPCPPTGDPVQREGRGITDRGQRLLERLRSLSRAENLAVVEVAERFWLAVGECQHAGTCVNITGPLGQFSRCSKE